jgi:hypothetical protein
VQRHRCVSWVAGSAMAGKRGFCFVWEGVGWCVGVGVGVGAARRADDAREESRLRDALRVVVVNAEYTCSLSRDVFQFCNEYYTP